MGQTAVGGTGGTGLSIYSMGCEEATTHEVAAYVPDTFTGYGDMDQLAPPSVCIKAHLVRRAGERLGLDLEYVPERETLPIRSIAGEAALRWNHEHPDEALQQGDRIVEVNGVTGTAEDMMKAIRADAGLQPLVLTAVRLADWENADDWEFLQLLYDDQSTVADDDQDEEDQRLGSSHFGPHPSSRFPSAEDDVTLEMQWAERLKGGSGMLMGAEEQLEPSRPSQAFPDEVHIRQTPHGATPHSAMSQRVRSREMPRVPSRESKPQSDGKGSDEYSERSSRRSSRHQRTPSHMSSQRPGRDRSQPPRDSPMYRTNESQRSVSLSNASPVGRYRDQERSPSQYGGSLTSSRIPPQRSQLDADQAIERARIGLAPSWNPQWSKSQSRVYFYHTSTGETTWVKPQERPQEEEEEVSEEEEEEEVRR